MLKNPSLARSFSSLPKAEQNKLAKDLQRSDSKRSANPTKAKEFTEFELESTSRHTVCQRHHAPYTQFCMTCFRPICAGCQITCFEHTVVSLEEFVASEVTAAPSAASVASFATTSECILRDIPKEIDEWASRVAETETTLALADRFLAEAHPQLTADLGSADRLCGRVEEALAHAQSPAGRAVFRQTLAALSFREHVPDTVAKLLGDRRRMQRELASARAKLISLRESEARFRFSSALRDGALPRDPLGQLTVALAMQESSHPSFFSNSVASYSSFRDCETVPAVTLALAATLEPVPGLKGVRMSAPVPADGLPAGAFSHISASLTSQGVFVFFDGARKELHLVDLRDGSSARIGGFADHSFVATINHFVAVGTCGEAVLRRARLEELLLDPRLETFEEFEIPVIEKSFTSFARTDTCPWTGKVIYRGPGGVPTELDVRTLQATVRKSIGWVNSLASGTGIALPSSRCQFSSGYSIHSADSRWRRGDPIANTKDDVTLTIPSSETPEDLTRALFLGSDRNLYFRGRSTMLKTPFRPARGQALCRVRADVFLAFCEIRGRWVYARIAVP
eukprot:gnl/Chilomastix_cuspidata/4548.p1 GENE.gnl/Chilomastix_cuspidata/4548~~gnl/Chilomastix_cuspidata/4548.p1  ORF type:complete len:569 (-),score=260.27 gnl/Chilomastix_cuspidata/4548:1250-2956(-)